MAETGASSVSAYPPVVTSGSALHACANPRIAPTEFLGPLGQILGHFLFVPGDPSLAIPFLAVMGETIQGTLQGFGQRLRHLGHPLAGPGSECSWNDSHIQPGG